MSPTVKNILLNVVALVLGWFIGGFVNVAIIELGHHLMPIEGFDRTSMETMANAFSNLESKYFIFPFLGHALGTLVGAIIACWIARTHKMKFAIAIGFIFLLGGIYVNIIFPAPIWFNIVDLTLAYLPMGWLGGMIGIRLFKTK